MPMKPIASRPTAGKALRSIPATAARRIVGKIEAYATDPASQTDNVKALQGQDGLRLRVGDWRVVMLDGEVLDVVKIGPRGSVC